MHDAEQLEQTPFGTVNAYTNAFHAAQNDPLLNDVYAQAAADHVSVVSPNVAHLLETLVTARQPKRVLELGTAYGVSTLHMKRALASDATLVTVELVGERQERAREFLAREGALDDGLVFVQGDFREDGFFESLHAQHGAFDFVFLDAAKGQYQHLLDRLTPMLAPGGMIVFDNIFLNGWIIADAYPNHRQKTAFVRMKAFLEGIKTQKLYSNTLLSFDDGVLILSKKEEVL
ncbi:MAG: O-methyltransferase [Peptococcaceae bacterium]|nr:O-methyltransferase [Peptococcaceae bacterium]